MNNPVQQPVLRLPESAVPDGCRPWDGAQAARWAGTLPPVWALAHLRMRLVFGGTCLGVIGAFWLTTLADLKPFMAALLPLQILWLLRRPEVARVSAPVLVVVLLMQRPGLPWVWSGSAVLLLIATWVAAAVRLHARGRQRERALAAAGGVTAEVPGAGRRLERGTYLFGLGGVLAVLGAVLVATSGLWRSADDRVGSVMVGCFVAGLGVTALVSGALGRRRAAALGRAPVPVLRVLVRDDAEADTEVFAVDDVEALRPLFTVSLLDMGDDEDDEDEDDVEGDVDEEELEALLQGLDTDIPGPLREAVLYGAPYDGAEVVVVSAPQEAGDPPLVERSTGPVRPLREGAARRRIAAGKAKAGRAARRQAVYEERRAAAALAAVRDGGGPARRWSAGWLDRITVVAVVLWGCYALAGESGVWRYVIGAGLGLLGVFLLPGHLAWRITADAAGLWFRRLGRSRHIAWDHIRVVECKGTQLRADSYRAGFEEWSVSGPRWPWLERKFGLIHPYERVAAEIDAMWQDPALRPTAESGTPERGLGLWPVAVGIGVAWAVALTLLP
ncbi:hypothetical protein [Streptomyces avermitilis]|uniref:hypothetical protein n=1 Tax=Streptomyces avermitilis TaxID=33903 RepID=UPI0033BD32CA